LENGKKRIEPGSWRSAIGNGRLKWENHALLSNRIITIDIEVNAIENKVSVIESFGSKGRTRTYFLASGKFRKNEIQIRNQTLITIPLAIILQPLNSHPTISSHFIPNFPTTQASPTTQTATTVPAPPILKSPSALPSLLHLYSIFTPTTNYEHLNLNTLPYSSLQLTHHERSTLTLNSQLSTNHHPHSEVATYQ